MLRVSTIDRRSRLQRSELAVPATSPQFFAKAASGAADAVFLDLEDSVAPNMKAEARAGAIRALRDHDWGGKTMAVRINDLDTPWAHQDLVAVVAHAPRLDVILLPKVARAEDVQFLDRLLILLEKETGRERPIGIEILIETALGVANVEEIAASSPRLEAIIFGVGDYTVEMHTGDIVFGQPNPNYAMTLCGPDGIPHRHLNDQWHFALARIANACRAHGLRPIDGPFTDFGDAGGFRASAERALALGFEGKWAIHPSQIAAANQVFSPHPDRLRWARETIEALRQGNENGRGALAVNSVLVDMAHAKIAEQILRRATAISRMQQPHAQDRN